MSANPTPYHFSYNTVVSKKPKTDFVDTPQVGDHVQLPEDGEFPAGRYEVQLRIHEKDADGCPIIVFRLAKV